VRRLVVDRVVRILLPISRWRRESSGPRRRSPPNSIASGLPNMLVIHASLTSTLER
jgi:hypothetical protein